MHFGYYGNGFSAWGPVEDRGDLRWILDGDPLADDGRIPVIVVTTLLFEHPRAKLRPDAEQQFRARYEGRVGAVFLLFDEPWQQNKWNGEPLTYDQVTEALSTAAAMVRRVCPTCSTLVTASGGEMRRYKLPTVDWLGMYQYSYNTMSIELMYSFLALVYRKSPWQKIMAVCDAYAKPDEPVNENRSMGLNRTWKWLVDIYKNEVVAVCPFMYQSTPAIGKGADQMPQVRAYFEGWRQIMMSTS